LQGDRIHQVFGVDESYMLETDEQGGQVFLKALSPETKPLTLTLFSEKGHTYDVRLRPRITEAQSILLKPWGAPKKVYHSAENNQDLLVFIKDMANQVQRDDNLIDRNPAKQTRETEEIVGTLLFTYEDDESQGLSFLIRNKQPYGISLSPGTFARQGDQAVALQEETLAPFASMMAYVVRRKEG
jgi:hypothetical protein